MAKDLASFQAEIQASGKVVSSVPVWNQLKVTTDNAKVLSGADDSKPVEFTAKKGQTFLILDRVNDFYAVAGDKGNTGWITAADVKPESDDMAKGAVAAIKKAAGGGIVYMNPVQVTATGTDSDMTAMVFKTLTEKAVQFRDSYKDNKYLYVSGFTVHVGIPPSVDLTFGFR